MSNPKIIENWVDLVNLESPTHYLEIDLKYGSGWILPKANHEDQDDYFYLSTHSFYGSHFESATRVLHSYGFDVKLVNWDKE